MRSPLTGLGLTSPVLAAPMAGGASAPEFVIESGRAGSLGFLAGGYKDVDALSEQIAAVRAANVSFGVNLFAPNPVPISPEEFQTYARLIQPEADLYGIDLGAARLREDDDQWDEKVALLIADPVPVVSFTFGIPSSSAIASLRKGGTTVIQTVTSAKEAKLAADAGVDVIIVQASSAGGHSATLTPAVIPPKVPLNDLIRQVTAVVRVPVIGAGGIGRAAQVTAALRAGADAVSVGTVLLRAVESGASAVHKAALADAVIQTTIVTRAFTGRPARALPNEFTDKYTDFAPIGYPAVHHLTGPIRSAAANARDPQRVHLWAGTEFKQARVEPVCRILSQLASRV
jgi:NAD(P)H-dependent flavin oxidoreductase YrpB (nitropropane dioxygenase family)